METVCILLVACLTNVMCFFIGAKVGQTAAKGEEITLPNPVEAAKEHREQREAQKEAQREQNRIDAILRNIDNYNGTEQGQEEV